VRPIEIDREASMTAMRLRGVLCRGLQALALFFAIAQTAAPLLHAHFSDGGAGDSGVHIHLGMTLPPPGGDHIRTREIRDFEARILTAPDEYFKDEPLHVLDLPAVGSADFSTRDAGRPEASARFVSVPRTAAQPFPKPLPLAPPASA
jgi:hypothetical protein